jgi:hypothetical protein
MVRGFLILIVLLILLITGAPAVAQKPTFEVSVDRTIIHVDETFHLTITLNGPHSGIALDLSPFTKDFDILSTSQRTHSANIDGQTEISMEWIITLAPKRLGELVIPSIEVGNHRSPPISVTVLSLEQAGLSRSVLSERGVRGQRCVLMIPPSLKEVVEGVVHITRKKMNTLTMPWQHPLKGMME